MDVDVRHESDRTVVNVAGDLTRTSDLSVLESTISGLLREGARKLTLHMDGVTYVDSAGLGQLVQLVLMAKREGGDLKIAGVTKRLKDLLHLTKILGPLDDSLAEFPHPVDARLPTLNPVMWSVLVVTLAILAMLAIRAMLGAP